MTMAAEFDAVLKAPFGALGVRTEGDAVAEIRFLPQIGRASCRERV